MKGFTLSKEQLSELKTAHRKAKHSNAHAAYKINTIILLGAGWTLTQVKQAHLLDEETLRSYVKKYQEKGIEGFIQTHYSGRSSSLSEAQKKSTLRKVRRLASTTRPAI